MKDFVAIDFETANRERTSICSVGLVRVENGDIREKIYRLIRPYPDYYSSWNTRIHGLTYRDTAHAAPFPEVWADISPELAGLPLVAHNSPFDEDCLKAAFRQYGMAYPDYRFFLHVPGVSSGFRPGITESSASNRRSPLRFRSSGSPSCAGRCRSLCLDRPPDSVKGREGRAFAHIALVRHGRLILSIIFFGKTLRKRFRLAVFSYI